MNAPLRICFMCRTFLTYQGGTESYYFRMANGLSSLGHDVHIVAQKGNGSSYMDRLSKSVNVHLVDFVDNPFSIYELIDRYVPITLLRYARTAEKKIKEIKTMFSFDIIQFPDWSYDGLFLLGHKDTPVIVRLHGAPNYTAFYPTHDIKPSVKTRLVWTISRQMIHHADSVCANSYDFSHLVKRSLLYDKPISVIHNGIDQSLFKPGAISERNKSVLFVGRIEEHKGIGVLAKAIPHVLRDCPDVTFIFAGRSCNYRDTRKTWADFLREILPVDNLVFMGQISQEELVTLYQKSMIAVFPSLYEPHGVAALESMACGCATIASRVGGLAESITSGKDGILVRVGDHQSLADAIKLLLCDDSLRQMISANGVKKVDSHFNLSTIIDETIRYYRDVLRYRDMSKEK
jgi:glycogen synthase